MQDYKLQVANAISAAVDGQLSQDEILSKIEIPKALNLGDYAFPAFVLSKVLRKAPQAIAAELVEKIDQTGFEKLKRLDLMLTSF